MATIQFKNGRKRLYKKTLDYINSLADIAKRDKFITNEEKIAFNATLTSFYEVAKSIKETNDKYKI